VRITQFEVFVLGDPAPPEPVDDRIAHLACIRIATDEGISRLSEVFAVPPAVAKAALDGPDSFFGQWLIGADPIPPEWSASASPTVGSPAPMRGSVSIRRPRLPLAHQLHGRATAWPDLTTARSPA
jgi:hypothetical protein